MWHSAFQHTFENIWRNRWFSVMLVSMMAVTLTIFNLVFSVFLLAQEAFANLDKKLTSTVYLKENADFFSVSELIRELQLLPYVKPPVVYTSSENALKLLLENYQLQAQTYAQYPIKLPASLMVSLRSSENLGKLQKYLSQAKYQSLIRDLPSSDKKREESTTTQVAESLGRIRNFTFSILIWVSLATLLGTLLIIGAAIHMTFANRKLEIEIMKLVGAEKKRIQLPFLLETLIFIVAAFLISLPLFGISLQQFQKPILFTPNLSALPNVLLLELLILLIVGFALSVYLSSRYLHKKIKLL